jgi:hypothetical protein
LDEIERDSYKARGVRMITLCTPKNVDSPIGAPLQEALRDYLPRANESTKLFIVDAETGRRARYETSRIDRIVNQIEFAGAEPPDGTACRHTKLLVLQNAECF